MKFLVTGGAGFIGSNLAEDLVSKGNELIVIDNLHTGSKENLSSIMDKITFIEKPSIEINNINLPKVDGIFHLGIPSSSPMYKKDPKLFGYAISAFIEVMEYAKKNNSRVVFASTASLYNGKEPPHREDMDILVTDYYTEARLVMERLAKLYYDLYNVRTIGLRFFSVYGNNEKSKKQYANLVTQFLWEMKGGKKPVIYGDGTQTRDFVFVKDVVRALNLAMESGIGYDIFNVGTGENATTNKLVEMLNQALGTAIEPEYIENPIRNYVFHIKADTSKAERKLGFRAEYSLERGIKELMRIY